MSTGFAFWAGGVPPPAPPPNLDAYTTGLYGAYALNRLLTGYAGHAMRVRRSSDNTTLDVDFLSSGAMDTVSMLAFCGSGDGFVAIVYDQSGGGNNLAQANTAKQPKIVGAGSYLSSITFDGSDDCFQTVNNNSGSAAVSMYMSGTLNSTGTLQYFLESDDGTGGTSAATGSTGWRYNQSGNTYDVPLVSNGAANVILGAASPPPLSNSTHTVVTDYTQATPSTRELYYSNAAAYTLGFATTGTIPTTVTLQPSPWNVGARNNGASFPAHLSLKNLLIYSVNHAAGTVGSVTTVLNYYL